MEALPSYYRSVDPVENLRLRVIIRKSSSSAVTATVGAVGEPDSNGGPLDMAAVADAARAAPAGPGASGGGFEIYDQLFSWQEKVFSPRCVCGRGMGARVCVCVPVCVRGSESNT